jgi:serine/threonine-protein kinase RsbW
MCCQLELDEVLAYQIELCAIEGVTNAIRHSYHGVPGQEVTLEVHFDAKRIELEISNRGERMDAEHAQRLEEPLGIPDVDPVDIADLPEGGMGLQIIKTIMDQTSYSSSDGINRLKMTKQL